MSCTSPKTVASTTVPLVVPSRLSRNCSRCATAFFITSADCSTNGKISSPRPNRSPTSFIAGKQNLVEHVDRRARCAAPRRSSPRCRPCAGAESPDAMRSSIGVLVVGGRRRAARRRRRRCSKCSIKRASASGRRLKTRSSQSSRTSASISKYGVISLRMHERAVEAGLDAMVQKDRVERRARGRLETERNVRDAERRQNAGQLALDRAQCPRSSRPPTRETPPRRSRA